MRLIPRRKFLYGLGLLSGAALCPLKLSSADIGESSEFSNTTSPSDLPREFFDWYCEKFFDFKASLSNSELEYIEAAISHMGRNLGYQVEDNLVYSLFAFSHQVQGNRVNSSRAAFGSFLQSKELLPLVEAVVAKRGIATSEIPHFERTIGLGWDVEQDHLKLYMHHEALTSIHEKSMKDLMRKVGDRQVHEHALSSVTLKSGEIYERKVYLGMKERLPQEVSAYPFAKSIVHTNLMITDRRGIVPQVDVQAPVEGQIFNALGQEIINSYKNEKYARLDTISYTGAESYTLYFP